MSIYFTVTNFGGAPIDILQVLSSVHLCVIRDEGFHMYTHLIRSADGH